MYEFTSHLGMHIQCTNGTPILDTLDHLPPLPLLIKYTNTMTEEDEFGICHALRLHDRVRHISLHLPPSTLHKCLVLMDNHFPMLEHLSLSFTVDKITTLSLPKAFLAPNLHHLAIPGIKPLKRLRVLASTVSLVKVVLWNIQASSYFRPRLLVARLQSLPQLEELSIGFSIPIPRPSSERELLGEEGTPVMLPKLKYLRFRGVSLYLESLVAQISALLLERLDITLFNQIAFTLPHLSHLINSTEGFKLPIAQVLFTRNGVTITTARHNASPSNLPFLLRVRCRQLDWQIDCAAQICSALIPILSDVERITLYFYEKVLPTEWWNGEIDGTTWHELLRSFIGVKELRVYVGLVKEVSRALQVGEVGSEPGFLPDLHNIVSNSWVFREENLFASFIDARRAAGRPVRYIPGQPLPPPDRMKAAGSWATWQRKLPSPFLSFVKSLHPSTVPPSLKYTPPPSEPMIHLAPEVPQQPWGLFGPRSPPSSSRSSSPVRYSPDIPEPPHDRAQAADSAGSSATWQRKLPSSFFFR